MMAQAILRSLVGDRNRRLLFRHAAQQLRDPGMLVRVDFRLAHDGHRAGDHNSRLMRRSKLRCYSLVAVH
jgi:hypothetical protein